MPVSKKFSPKDEYHIHLKLYEPLNNPLLIQYLDAFWQIYQQVEKGLPPPILSPEKLAMQHRELMMPWKHMIGTDATRDFAVFPKYSPTLTTRRA